MERVVTTATDGAYSAVEIDVDGVYSVVEIDGDGAYFVVEIDVDGAYSVFEIDVDGAGASSTSATSPRARRTGDDGGARVLFRVSATTWSPWSTLTVLDAVERAVPSQERKTDDQKRVLYQVKADAIAHALVDLNELNLRGGAEHCVGSCVYKLIVYAADKSNGRRPPR